MTYFIWDTCK